MSADRIALLGLAVRGHLGVFDHERRDGQDFVVDVTVWLDLTPAAASDDLADTLDYGDLARRVAAIVGGALLVPNLAVRLLFGSAYTGIAPLLWLYALATATRSMMTAYVGAVEVTLHKPQAPIPLEFADVAVVVHRSRTPARTGPRIIPA